MTKRKFEFIPAFLAGFCTTALLLGSFPAHAESPVAPAIEVVRPGDRAMTCAALAAEINQLSRPQAVAEVAKPKKHGLGFLKVLGSAIPLAGGLGGGMGGAIVSSVAGSASQAAMGDQVDQQMTEARQMARDAMAGGSPAQQRKERLTAIFDEKRC